VALTVGHARSDRRWGDACGGRTPFLQLRKVVREGSSPIIVCPERKEKNFLRGTGR